MYTLTTRTIQCIEQSLNLLLPRAGELIDRYYATLFAENPGFRPYFPVRLNEQKECLLLSLVAIVNHLKSKQADGLGVAGVAPRFGTTCLATNRLPEHYAVMRNTLVDLMAEMLESEWRPEMAHAWIELIDLACSSDPPS